MEFGNVLLAAVFISLGEYIWQMVPEGLLYARAQLLLGN